MVHLEPFGRPREPRLQVLIDSFNEAWGVRAEPGFWFVDERGEVAAYLAIVATDDELAGAISAISRIAR